MEIALIIDGKKIAEKLRAELKTKIATITSRKPCLAFLLVGDNPASKIYVGMKQKYCKEVGIESVDQTLPDNCSQEEILEVIRKWNLDPQIDGILVQLPLPSHIETPTILSALDPHKDVDGFHPVNLGKLLSGEKTGFVPCTPLGIQVLLQEAKIPVEGKHVVIVGRSTIVGKPLAALLMQKAKGCNATVTLAHSLTHNLEKICQSAEILIVAIGKPHFITEKMVSKGTVIIDVGINKLEDGTLVGDVDFEHVAPLASAITPVPGGVGPMTIAMLLSNTLLSFERRRQQCQ